MDRRTTDSGALQLLRDGDQKGLELLWHRHAPKLRAVGKRWLPDPHAVEDMVTDTFRSAWRLRAAADPTRGSAMGWLVALARTAAKTIWRGEARRETRDAVAAALHPPAAPPAGERALVASRRQAHVRAAIAALPDAQRAVIEGIDFGGFSYAELAERLGEPEGTVKSRHRLAVAKLEEALAGIEEDLADAAVPSVRSGREGSETHEL